MATPPTVAKIAKVTPGYIMDISDFLNSCFDKQLGGQLLDGLTRSGLTKVCTFEYESFFEGICAQFYSHSTLDRDAALIKSVIDGLSVEIRPSDIRNLFEFSENHPPSINHRSFDQVEFWKVVRQNQDETEVNFQTNSMKLEFKLLNEVIQKCVFCILGGGGTKCSHNCAMAMYAVYHGKCFDWSLSLFSRLTDFCRLRGHVGYGLMVGEILRRKGFNVGSGIPITVHQYVLRRSKRYLEIENEPRPRDVRPRAENDDPIQRAPSADSQSVGEGNAFPRRTEEILVMDTEILHETAMGSSLHSQQAESLISAIMKELQELKTDIKKIAGKHDTGLKMILDSLEHLKEVQTNKQADHPVERRRRSI